MAVALRGLSTVVPPTVLIQEEVRDVFGTQPGLNRLAQRIVSTSFNVSGIEKRHTVLAELSRDAQDTGQFQGPPAALCLSDADCAAPFPSCEQNHHGAFRNALATAITEEGSPAGALVDRSPRFSTLVSVFCIPPSFNPIIDPNADIPGPGAVALPGTFDINSPSGAFVDGGSLF